MSIYFWIFLPLWLFVTFLLLWLIPRAMFRQNCVGDLIVTQADDKTIFSLEIDRDPKDLESMTYVSFKVKKDAQDISSL